MKKWLGFLIFIMLCLYGCKKDGIDNSGNSSDIVYDTTFLDKDWYHISNFDTHKPTDKITSITCDQDDNIWISAVWDSSYFLRYEDYWTPSGGWYTISIDTTIYLSYILELRGINIVNIIDYSVSEYLDVYVSSIGFDNQNNLYLGTTIGDGLLKYDMTNFQKFLPPGGLVYKFNDFTFDNDNNLWFGAGNGGLYRFDGESFYNYTRANSIMPYPEYVCEVVIDDSNTIWFNTSTQLMKITEQEMSIFCCNIRSNYMDIDKEGNIWVGNSTNIKKISGEYYEVFEVPIIESNNPPISDLVIDSKNNVWISSKDAYGQEGQGLLKFDGTNWSHYNVDNSELHSNNITKLYTDRFDNIWIISLNNGITIFNEDGIRY